jgi:hypothetical protein
MKSFRFLPALGAVLAAGLSAAHGASGDFKFRNISADIGVGTAELKAVANNGTNFILVGSNGIVLRGAFTNDQPFYLGGAWDQQTVAGLPQRGVRGGGRAVTNDLLAAASGTTGSGSYFVIGGERSTPLVSTDGGRTWMLLTSGQKQLFGNQFQISGLSFNGGRFMASSHSPQMKGNSGNPLNTAEWRTASYSQLSYLEAFNAVTPYAGGFAACGDLGVLRVATSPSGRFARESGRVNRQEPDYLALATRSNLIVCVGATRTKGSRSGAITAFSSSGGPGFAITKVTGTFPVLNGVQSLGADAFIAVGDGPGANILMGNANGTTWDPLGADRWVGALPPPANLATVTYATSGSLRGVGLIAGQGVVALFGTDPLPPVVVSQPVACSGDPGPALTARINDTSFAGLITLDWFDLGGAPQASSSIGGGFFELIPPAADPNVLRTNVYSVRARDLRTGFVSPAVTIEQIVLPRPQVDLVTTNAICNGQSTTLHAMLKTGGLPISPTNAIIARWDDGYEQITTDSEMIHRTVSPVTTEPNGAAVVNYSIVSLIRSNVMMVKEGGIDVLRTNLCTASKPGDITGVDQVIVIPRPTALLTTSNAVCNGSPATLSVGITGLLVSTNTVTIVWNDGLEQTTADSYVITRSGIQVTNPNANAAISNDFWVRSIRSSNVLELAGVSTLLVCSSNWSGDIVGTNQVTVYPRPSAMVSGSTNLCNGQSAAISAVLRGLGPWTVVWASNNVPVYTVVVPGSAGPVTNYLNVTPSNPNANSQLVHSYSVLTLTDANCAANAGDISAPALVTVNPRPTATLLDTNAVCNGSDTTVRAYLTGLLPLTATWQDGLVQNVTAGTAIATNNGLVGFVVARTLDIPNADGATALVSNLWIVSVSSTHPSVACAANDSGDIQGTNQVIVVPRPTATLLTTNVICDGDSTEIYAYLTGVPPLTVRWNDGLEQTTNATVITRTVTPRASDPNNFTGTNYSIVEVVSLGSTVPCSNSVSADIRGVNRVIVDPRPTAALVATDVQACSGTPVTLTVNVTGLANAVNAVKIYWQDGVEQMTSGTNRTITRTLPATDTAVAITNDYFITNVVGLYMHSVTGQTVNVTCEGNPADLTGVAHVVINPLPSALVYGTTSVQVDNGDKTTNSVFAILPGNGPWWLRWKEFDPKDPNEGGDNVTRYIVQPWTGTNVAELVRTNQGIKKRRTIVYSLVALTNETTGCYVVDANGIGGTNAWLTLTPKPTSQLFVSNVVSIDNTTRVDICVGESVRLDIDLGGAPDWRIRWSDGLVETNSMPDGLGSRMVTPVDVGTYVFSISNLVDLVNDEDDDRTANTNDLIGVVVINVLPRPTNAPVSLGDVAVYECVVPTLAVSVSEGNTANWYLGTNRVASQTNSYSPVGLLPGTYHYEVAEVNAALCEGVNRTMVMLTVLPRPDAAPVPSDLNPTNVCFGNPATLDVTNSTGNSANWYSTNNLMQRVMVAGGTNSYSISNTTPGGIYVFEVVEVNAVGCEGTNILRLTLEVNNCAATAKDGSGARKDGAITTTVMGQTNIVVEWVGAYELQCSTELIGSAPWISITNGSAGVLNRWVEAIEAGSPQKYFRTVPVRK